MSWLSELSDTAEIETQNNRLKFAAIPDPAPGFWQGSLTAIDTGLTKGALKIGDTFGEGPGKARYGIDEAPTIEDFHKRKAEARKGYAKVIQDLTPDPATTGLAGQMLNPLADIIPRAAVGAAFGGPVASGLLAGIPEYTTGKTMAEAEGIDPKTASKKAAIDSVTMGVGAMLPAAGIFKNVWGDLGATVGANVLLGIGQRGGTAHLLEENGYTTQAGQYQAFDKTSMVIDAILGAAFFGVARVTAPREIAPTEKQPEPGAVEDIAVDADGQVRMLVRPETVDAALVQNQENHASMSGPGVPVDPKSASAHQQSLQQALEQMAQGVPVTITAEMEHAAFLRLPRGVRNNNPGNIRMDGTPWQGLIPGADKSFATFDTPESGIRALGKNLLTYQDKHGLDTVQGIIQRWAPPTENQTSAYIGAVAREMGVQPGDKLNLRDQDTLFKLTKAIIKHENGRNPYHDKTVMRGVEKALTNRNNLDSKQAVKQNLMDQLNTTERLSPEMNEANAELMASYFHTRAEQMGMTPEELFAQSLLNAKAEGMDGAQFDQSAANDLVGKEQALKSLHSLAAETYDEGTAPDAAYDLLYEASTPEQQYILRALERDDFLGFDYPHQAIEQLIRNPEAYELSPSTKALISRAGNSYFNQSALSPTEQAMQNLNFGGRQIDDLEAEYAQLPDSDGGHVIDADLVRDLSPEYRDNRRLAPRIHAAASDLTKQLFARALARPVAEGRQPKVVFMAGGGGSGKSMARDLVAGKSNDDITLDGTLSNLERARANIQAALDSGREVDLYYVYRSPQNSVAGAIDRAIETGRPVPVSALAEGHANSPKVVKALAQEYHGDDRVRFRILWNDGSVNEAREISIKEIPNVDQNQAESIFRNAVESARESGRIDQELYTAFTNPEHLRSNAGSHASSRPEQSSQVPLSGQDADLNQAARGSYNPDTRTIALLNGADASTPAHEAAHFFFDNDIRMAGNLINDANARDSGLLNDVDALLAWHGFEGSLEAKIDAWNALDVDAQRVHHERTAEAFEAYLMEGKAPTPELKTYFDKLKAWITDVYESLKRFMDDHPEAQALNDDVRAIFDRMLSPEKQAAAPVDDAGFMRRIIDGVSDLFSIRQPGSQPQQAVSAFNTANRGGDSVEMRAAIKAIQADPNMRVVLDDGREVTATEALQIARDEITQAQNDSMAYDAAVTCLLRTA